MDSGTVVPSLEPLAVSNAQPHDMGLSGSLDMDQSAVISGDTSGQASPSRTVLKTPPKNGVPPKRLSMTTKRNTSATASTSSKSNPPPISRSAPGTGLSKPPTRPSISSAVRRPATSVTSATAASTGHRKRPSIASNDINSIKRGDLSGAEENIKPASSKGEARRNVYDKGELKNAVQGFNADRPNLATKAEQSATSGRMGNTSPVKSVLRTTTNNSRPSSIHTTSRGIRTTASSTGGVPKVETAKKRLSTIPASPAPANPETNTLESLIAPAATEARRPVLHSRKSTMSITIEQRLREMELVHQMLRVAMAEDGNDNDEVKEEYGRKVDESLASLRVRLEEARRNEGIDPQDKEVSKVSSEKSNGVTTYQATSGDGKLLEALRESEGKVFALSDEISDLRRRLQQATSSAENAAKVSSQHHASIDTQGPLQEEIQRLREMQALKINELSENHQSDLAAAQAERDEAESRYQEEYARLRAHQADAIALAVSECSAEAANKLESEVNAYTLKLQTLELDLGAERESNTLAASMSEELKLEVSRLRNELSQERRTLADMERSLVGHDDLLGEKENTISEKGREILDLHLEMQEQHTDHARQLEEVKRISMDRHKHLEDELSMVRNDLSLLELSHQSIIASHDSEIVSKDEEIKGLAQVIEGFQTQLQSIHEQKEREVNETKLELIEEHEKVVSDLHRKHRDEIAEMELSNKRKLQALLAEHENALGSARDNYAINARRMDELLQSSEIKNETIQYEVFNGKAIVEKLEMQVASLKHEKAELDDTFKQASDEITGLKKTLETLGCDAEDKDRQYAAAVKKLEEELAETTKALEEGRTERETTLKRHVEEIDSLISLHAVDMKALESESRDTLLELQKNHDKLIAQSIQTEREYGEELGALKSEHAETLEKRAKDLENLITTHATETRDKLDQIERTHQEEIRALVQSTDQKYESLCQEVNTANEQLQKHRDSRDKELVQAERCEELAKLVDSLKSELAKSQVELSQANNEIARLTTEVEEARKTLQDTTESDQLRYEMFELTRQHAAEIARVQETVSVENEKRAKERKQGAEVRDRLVSETEKLTNDLSAAKLEAEKYRMDLHLAKAETQEEVQKNDANCQSIELHKAAHQKAADDLKVAQAEIEKLKSSMSQHGREELSNVNQELEALQIAADSERETNTKLRDEIREASVTAERQASRLRELESALKVTTAELVEAQTVRPNGSEYSASPAPKSGLRSSRWAIPDAADQIDGEYGEDDEHLGSTIYGNMAGMQEQIRQMEDINKDMLEDEQRIMEKLSALRISSTSASNAASSTRDTNEAYEEVL